MSIMGSYTSNDARTAIGKYPEEKRHRWRDLLKVLEDYGDLDDWAISNLAGAMVRYLGETNRTAVILDDYLPIQRDIPDAPSVEEAYRALDFKQLQRSRAALSAPLIH